MCFIFFFFSACEGPESCIEADDFGNSNKIKIIVYPYDSIYLTSPENVNLCYPSEISDWKTLSSADFLTKIQSIPFDSTNYSKSKLLRYCLLGFNDYTRTTVGNTESLNGTQNTQAKRDERGCYLKTDQQRIDCYEACADGCKQLFEIPRWKATDPSTETLKGIDIEPNTMISFKVKGQVSLGDEPKINIVVNPDLNQIQPSWSVNNQFVTTANYNVKLPEQNSEVNTYTHYSKVILINRKNPVSYVNIASGCNINYLMRNFAQQDDQSCPVNPSNIGMLNTKNPANQDDFNSVETLSNSDPVIQNLSDEDEYLILQNNGTEICTINLEVTDLGATKKFIKFNNYKVSNKSTFANADYYPLNSQLITLFSNTKLKVLSKTNCGDIVFKKFKFIDIPIMQTGFVSVKNITGETCNLKARIINPIGEKCIKEDLSPCKTEFLYDNSISPPEKISHFFEYDSNFNSSSIDPINNLSVTSSFSTNNIFVRKGQKIRILPETHQSEISFSYSGSSVTKKCGFGMFFKINPRPALMCFSAENKDATKIPNPSCKLNHGKYAPTYDMTIVGNPSSPTSIESTATDATPNPEEIECLSTVNCSDEAQQENSRTNPTTGFYCASPEKCAPVTCTYNATSGEPTCIKGTADSGYCSSFYITKPTPPPACCSSPDANSCDSADPNNLSNSRKCPADNCCATNNCTTEKLKSTCSVGSQAMCNRCQDARLSNLNSISKSISVKNFNCYDFENSKEFSSYRLIDSVKSSNKFEDDFKKKYNIKDLTTIETNDGLDYGNLLSYENFSGASGSGFKKIENLISFVNQEVTFFKINNQNFKNFTSDSILNENYEFYTSDIITYSNGQKLEAVLCKESSSTSIDCIPMSTSQIEHSSTSTVLFSDAYNQPGSTKKNFIKINPDGKMERTLDFREDSNPDITNYGNALKCNQPAKYYTNKNWFCFKNDLGNPQEINKYKLTFRIKDVNDAVTDNNGKYEIEIYLNKFDNDSSSGVVKKILNLIMPEFFGSKDDPSTTGINEEKPGILKDFYTALTSHLLFKSVLNIAIVMSITFFGMGFLMGVSEIKHSEIMKILFKIGFIYLFVSPTIGWVWYNKFFVQLFTSATDYLTFSVALIFGNSDSISNKILSGDYEDKSILFASCDRILTMIFSDAVIGKTGALLFSSIFGWIYFVIIVYTFMNYIYAIANTILLFITCQITTVVLLIIGPFFFIFLLFNITKDMFDNWIKTLIGFSLQQIFLVLVISFFNGIIEVFLKNALGYRVCWTEVLKLNIILTTVALFNFWTVSGTNSTSVFGESDPQESFGNTQNMPPLISFISLYIIVGIMKKFTDFFSNLAASLAGGLKASTIGAEAKAIGNQAMGVAKGIASKIYNSTAGQLVERADKFLFDSGKIADAERKQQMDKIKGMIKDKANLSSVGKKAVDEYKKNNALKLAGMSQSEQKKTLENVRNNAIQNYAEYNGIKNVDEIMNMKGLNYNGTNLIMASAQAARQAISKDGALFNSARDKENQGKNLADISFSKDDAIQAMKSMNKEEKERFMSAIEDGTIHVNKGKVEQARSAIEGVVKISEAGIKAISNPINSSKAVVSGITSGAKYLAKSVNDVVSGSDLKKEAIKQLKSEGKIDRFMSRTPSFVENAIRSKEDNKLINERMQQIANDTRTFNERPKITSDHVIKNLKSFSETDEASKKSKTGINIKTSLKSTMDIAKNFISPKNEEGKTKNEKRLDQMRRNQDNAFEDLNKKKSEISRNGIDIQSLGNDKSLGLSRPEIKLQLEKADADIKKKTDDLKTSSSPEGKDFALALELKDKITKRESIKGDTEFMEKLSNNPDKNFLELAKNYISASNKKTKLKDIDAKADKLVESKSSPELKEITDYKKDLTKADQEISNRINLIDKMIDKTNASKENALSKIIGNNEDEKANKLNQFIAKNENIIKDYRQKNILKRMAIASIPFKGIFNRFKENENFNEAKKILKDFKKVKDSESLEKFVNKNQTKINDNT